MRNGIACLGLVLWLANAFGQVRLSGDWADYTPRRDALGFPVPLPGDERESVKLDRAVAGSALSRAGSAYGDRDENGQQRLLYVEDRPFKLYWKERLYYIAPVVMMTRSADGRICAPKGNPGSREFFLCEDGRRYTRDCHVFLFDSNFKEVAYQRIDVREPGPIFCDVVLSIGVVDRASNELLLTFAYSQLDFAPADKRSHGISSSVDMTVRMRLREDGGRVHFEQDDRCLGNPNRIEDVPTARAVLKRCREPN
ncbi:MAG: hypothetical protein ACOVPA_04635 [Rubrivivax sp.]